MAPLHRGVLRHTAPSLSPYCPLSEPQRVFLAQVKRGGGGGRTGIVAPYTYHGDCLCWLIATYVAHTSHYEAVLGASRPVTYSPWPGHRRVMANALWIKCILSLTARWHRCLDASSAISRLRHSLFPPLSCVPSLFRLDTSSLLARRRREFRLSFSREWRNILRCVPRCNKARCCIFLCQIAIISFENIDKS